MTEMNLAQATAAMTQKDSERTAVLEEVRKFEVSTIIHSWCI